MNLQLLKQELGQELNENILNYWVKNVYDAKKETFYGRITLDGKPDQMHNKSAVLITRILWTFSAAYRKFPKPEYKQMADEAYRIITTDFWDKENGGVFWEINSKNEPADTKKQFYALAFTIYATTEYYLAFNNEQAKQLAVSLYFIIEAYSYNPSNKGYIDVLSKEWHHSSGMRLSDKEIPDTMTMNTHLHVLEAYTNLFRVWPENELKQKLENLLRLFLDKIIDKNSWHFNLFFDKNWKNMGDVDSYGHDIEGTWLLYEAAEVLGDQSILKEVEEVAVKMAEVTIKEGFASLHNGLLYEKEDNHLIEEFHWWPQAEAVIGFFNLWQITKEKKYLNRAINSWEFIKKYIIDKEDGEWFWGLDKDLQPLNIEKVNGWKAPYHNGRMCLELIHRISQIEKTA